MPFNFFLVQHSGWDEHRETPVWRPSIHMPKEAARIFLLVKDVWEERLQDISYDDCLHEGIAYEDIAERDVLHQTDSARCLFAELWNSTIRPKDRDRYGWDANPGVRVIEFEVISREDAE